jgi:hypothetical protein
VDGLTIRRLRRGPAIMSENKRVFYSSFELDLEPGIGRSLELDLPRQPIVWRDEANASIFGGTIQKWVIPAGWDAGGLSVQQFAGNGYVEFTNTQTGLMRGFGLVLPEKKSQLSFDDVFEFGFKIDAADRIWIIAAPPQTGFVSDTGVDVAIGNVLKLDVQAGSNTVRYYVNTTLLGTATGATFPMRAKASLYTATASIDDAMIQSDNTGVSAESPQIMLRLSNDGGRTWLSEEMRGSGRIGEYLTRVRWNRLGAARRRVFEVVCTDSIPWRLTGAYLESQPGVKQA